MAEGDAVDLAVSVEQGRGDTAMTAEARSVALALAPGDPRPGIDLPPLAEPG